MGSIGYFTAEIGLWSELHTYSGGLGVLAGDHIKSAADSGKNLVAVTLLYREGYGRQRLDIDGKQTESFAAIDPNEHLIPTGLEIALPLDDTMLFAKVWKVEIKGIEGHHVPVYFLDTDHQKNSQYHRKLSARLYGGDDKIRIRQEYLLGVGGLQLLDSIGIQLKGLHLNEGHCTFSLLQLLAQGWTREDLCQKVLFTTHTPVPAGHDRFEWKDVEEVIGGLLPPDAKDIVKNAGDNEEGRRCSMSHLAVGLCNHVNGVSALNAQIAQSMYNGREIYPITNGIHHLTWVSSPMKSLFDKHIPTWKQSPEHLIKADEIPIDEVMIARQRSRKILNELIKASNDITLEEHRLTIGFARRFATYKRANLVFHDLERLRSIGKNRIQFVFSGKAHPKDSGGKQLIESIFGSKSELNGDIPVVFLENYDMDTGLAMTSGVDIWLNNPIRPMEASGTSGMKAAMNGVPNCSILDGWWPEACVHGMNGWALGNGEDTRDDARDAAYIYEVLEEQILPIWENDKSQWAEIVRRSIVASSKFTGKRMIEDYDVFYSQF